MSEQNSIPDDSNVLAAKDKSISEIKGGRKRAVHQAKEDERRAIQKIIDDAEKAVFAAIDQGDDVPPVLDALFIGTEDEIIVSVPIEIGGHGLLASTDGDLRCLDVSSGRDLGQCGG